MSPPRKCQVVQTYKKWGGKESVCVCLDLDCIYIYICRNIKVVNATIAKMNV